MPKGRKEHVVVKKFGGTSVANKERIFNVARRCIEDYKKGNDVVVVLSAMGKYTDELITMQKISMTNLRNVRWICFLPSESRCQWH